MRKVLNDAAEQAEQGEPPSEADLRQRVKALMPPKKVASGKHKKKAEATPPEATVVVSVDEPEQDERTVIALVDGPEPEPHPDTAPTGWTPPLLKESYLVSNEQAIVDSIRAYLKSTPGPRIQVFMRFLRSKFSCLCDDMRGGA